MKNEKKAWVLLFGFMFLVGSLLGSFNYFVDCANLFHNEYNKIAQAIVSGKKVYFPTHPNERECKEALVKVLPEHFDMVGIGASLLMTVNREMLGVKQGEFFNLGVSGMNLKDYINFLGMMKYYKKEVDTYIFLLHIDVFLPNDDTRHTFQDGYGTYYLAYLNGKKENIKKLRNRLFSKNNNFAMNLFSISYLKDNINYLRKHGFSLKERMIISNDYYEYAHYMDDGSWVYDVSYQKRSVQDVFEDIKNRGAGYMPKTYVDKENFILFDRIIHDLLKQGKKIILYFPPYCPSLYAAYPPQNSPCFKEIEDFISQYDTEKNITIFGSFYPKKCGLSDENFYDARHIRREDMPLAFRKID